MKRTLAAAVISAVLSIIITAVGVSSASIGNDLPADGGAAEVVTEDSGEDRQCPPADPALTTNGDSAPLGDTAKDTETAPETEISLPETSADGVSSTETTGAHDPQKEAITLPQYPDGAESLSLTVGDIDLPQGFAAVIGGIAYAPADELCGLLADIEVSGSFDDENTYRICGDGVDITAVIGEAYITSLGRVLWCGRGGEVGCLDDGVVILPIEPICRALGLEFEMEDGHAMIDGEVAVKSADDVYDSESLYWLSRIISAESRGEPFEGQIAVGCVVLNRLRQLDYLDSVYEVIFDRRYGIQFSPAYSGSVYNEPTESSVRAAKVCLEGYSISDSIIYFINSADILPEWMSVGCRLIVTIGHHDFYA